MKSWFFVILWTFFIFIEADGGYQQQFLDFKKSKDKAAYFSIVKDNDVWKVINKSCSLFLKESHLLCLWEKQFLELEGLVKASLVGIGYNNNIQFYQEAYKKSDDSQVFANVSREINKTLFLWHGVVSFLLKTKMNFVRSRVSDKIIETWLVDMTHFMSFINTFDIYTFAFQNYLWFQRYNTLDKNILKFTVLLYTQLLSEVDFEKISSRSFIEREFKKRNFLKTEERLSSLYYSALVSKLLPQRKIFSFYTIHSKYFSYDFQSGYEVTYKFVEQNCKIIDEEIKSIQFEWVSDVRSSFCDNIPEKESTFISELYELNCSKSRGVPYIDMNYLIRRLPESASDLSEYCSVVVGEWLYVSDLAKIVFQIGEKGLLSQELKRTLSGLGKKYLMNVTLAKLSSSNELETFNLLSEDFL